MKDIEEGKKKGANNSALKKRYIKYLALAIVLVPVILCIALLIRVGVLEKYIKDNLAINQKVSDVSSGEYASNNANTVNNVGEVGLVETSPSAYEEDNTYQEYDGIVKVCITFDDGPSANTDAILDILDDYGIKATFFVNGHEDYKDELIRIAEEGHTIGMHSYSHSYRTVYKNLDSFADDLYEIQSYIKDTTGVTSTIYRFPGGSSNHVSNVAMEDCIDYLHAKGIEYYDWNASGNDAVVGGASVNTIVNNVMNQVAACKDDTIIILLHDTGDKKTTVEALPIIIEKIADMTNVAFVPITEDVKPVHHIESNN